MAKIVKLLVDIVVVALLTYFAIQAGVGLIAVRKYSNEIFHSAEEKGR